MNEFAEVIEGNVQLNNIFYLLQNFRNVMVFYISKFRSCI